MLVAAIVSMSGTACAAQRAMTDRSARPAAQYVTNAPAASHLPFEVLNPFGSRGGEYRPPRWAPNLPHQGVDLAAPAGTEVVSVSQAYITEVRALPFGRGQWQIVLVPLLDAPSDVIVVLYAHLADVRVEERTFVERGDVLGLVWGGEDDGWTPHVHLQFCTDGRCAPDHVVDPLRYALVCNSNWNEDRQFIYPLRC